MVSTIEGTFKPFQEQLPTLDEYAELEHAKTMPIIFDEDCPETTPERASRFRRVNPLRKPVED